MADCFTNPAACLAEKAASTVAGSALDRITDSAVNAIQTMTSLVLTFWMHPVFSPTVAANEAPAASVQVLQDAMQPLVVVAAVIGILVACAQVALTHRAAPLAEVGKMFVAVIAVSGLAAISMQYLIEFGDKFAPWIIQLVIDKPYEQGIPDLFPKVETAKLEIFLLLLIGPLIVLAGLAQVLFMFFRAGVLPILLALLPLAAALSTSEIGKTWFKKMAAWALAFVLYKPIAALVYAGGFAIMRSSAFTQFSADPQLAPLRAVFQTLTGLGVLTLAVLCLPAMIKLVAPIAATGSSNLFSGAAVAGMAVTGAMTVATFGAGGAGVAAGAARALPTPTPSTPAPTGTPSGGSSGGSSASEVTAAPGRAALGTGSSSDDLGGSTGRGGGGPRGGGGGAGGSGGSGQGDGGAGTDGSPGAPGGSGPAAGNGTTTAGGATVTPAASASVGGGSVGSAVSVGGAVGGASRAMNDAVRGDEGPAR